MQGTERGELLGHADVAVGALLQQQLDDLDVADRDREAQRRIWQSGQRRIGAASQQQLDDDNDLVETTRARTRELKKKKKKKQLSSRVLDSQAELGGSFENAALVELDRIE